MISFLFLPHENRTCLRCWLPNIVCVCSLLLFSARMCSLLVAYTLMVFTYGFSVMPPRQMHVGKESEPKFPSTSSLPMLLLLPLPRCCLYDGQCRTNQSYTINAIRLNCKRLGLISRYEYTDPSTHATLHTRTRHIFTKKKNNEKAKIRWREGDRTTE